MTALASGNPFGTLRIASDLKARGRSYLRRGLFVSGLLHLALLAALIPLWRSGGGDVLLATIDGRVHVDPFPRARIVPPPEAPAPTPTVSGRPPDTGTIVPTLHGVIDVPMEPIAWSPPDAGVFGTAGGAPAPLVPGGDGAAAVVADPKEDAFVPFDTPPVAVYAPTPEYPDWAREAGVSGRVMLHVLVGADGAVRRIVVKEGVTGLTEPARAAVARWVFRPARANGKPVAVWVALPVLFRL